MIYFNLKKETCSARAGELTTNHGIIKTPVFMPVGTQGIVKTLDFMDISSLGYNLILNNMYHLYLRPGIELIEEMGGLHGFLRWNGSILTDSGGFQIFSLNGLRNISEEGVRFQSHFDGSYHFITPEIATEIQYRMGPDILMAFDECLAYPSTDEDIKKSVELTTLWASRCKEKYLELIEKDKHTKNHPSLFGIVQGGVNEDLRKYSAEKTVELDLPGYAIGGLSVGEPKMLMWRALDACIPLLPKEKPRYMMGVGTPEDMIVAIGKGVDMFDCVMPTRNARKGTVFTWKGKISLKAAYFAKDETPIDPDCDCYTCKNYSKAFLRHLFNVGEITPMRLATIHTLHFYRTLIDKARESIISGTFENFKKDFLANYRDELIHPE